MDNTVLNVGAGGDTIATKEVIGVKHELVILEFSDGAGGVTEVSATDKLPVDTGIDTASLATSANQTTEIAALASILAKLSADPATQATLAAVLTALNSIDAGTASALGQALMAASVPVAIASNQSAIPISGTVTVDTSLLATAAKQDTGNTSLASILAKIIAAPATEAKQDNEITQLTNLNAKDFATQTTLAAILAKIIAAPATAALQTQPGVDIGDVTVNNATGAAAVNIQDGGNSITVDNNGTFVTQSTLAAETTKVIGTINISAAQTIGTVTAVTAITNALPAGSSLIGKVGIDQTTPGTTNLVALTPGTPYHLVSAATTNATVVKASAGVIIGGYAYNSNAAARKIAFHNTPSTPTAGASIYATRVIPGLTGALLFTAPTTFTAGIAFTTVTGLADNDATAVAANDLIIDFTII